MANNNIPKKRPVAHTPKPKKTIPSGAPRGKKVGKAPAKIGNLKNTSAGKITGTPGGRIGQGKPGSNVGQIKDGAVLSRAASQGEEPVKNMPNLGALDAGLNAGKAAGAAEAGKASSMPPEIPGPPRKPQVSGNHPGQAQRELRAYDQKLAAWKAKYGDAYAKQQEEQKAQEAPSADKPKGTDKNSAPEGAPPRPIRPQLSGNHPGDAQRQLRQYEAKLRAWEAKYGGQ